MMIVLSSMERADLSRGLVSLWEMGSMGYDPDAEELHGHENLLYRCNNFISIVVVSIIKYFRLF